MTGGQGMRFDLKAEETDDWFFFSFHNVLSRSHIARPPCFLFRPSKMSTGHCFSFNIHDSIFQIIKIHIFGHVCVYELNVHSRTQAHAHAFSLTFRFHATVAAAVAVAQSRERKKWSPQCYVNKIPSGELWCVESLFSSSFGFVAFFEWIQHLLCCVWGCECAKKRERITYCRLAVFLVRQN